MGVVTPGGWVDFFRFVCDKYEGVLSNETDNRNTGAVMFPKFQEIMEKYDVIFQPQFVGGELSDWTEEDTKLPEGTVPYYLRANTGPRYLLGSLMSRPFITTKQTNDKFSITSLESSGTFDNQILGKSLSAQVHQVFSVMDGAIAVTLDGNSNEVRAGESIFIPAQTKFSVKFIDRFVRVWYYASEDGLEALVRLSGGEFDGIIVPDEPRKIDIERVTAVVKTLNISLSL